MARKDVLGRTGEQLAVEYLQSAGYTILERNWRCTLGEIDIVAQLGRTTVVVEVKTRSSTKYGHPLDAVTPVKLARLRRLSGAWCAENPGAHAMRIDVIGVIASHEGIEIDHIRQAC